MDIMSFMFLVLHLNENVLCKSFVGSCDSPLGLKVGQENSTQQNKCRSKWKWTVLTTELPEKGNQNDQGIGTPKHLELLHLGTKIMSERVYMVKVYKIMHIVKKVGRTSVVHLFADL